MIKISDKKQEVIFEFKEDAKNFKLPIPVSLRIKNIDLLLWTHKTKPVSWLPLWVHTFAVGGLCCLNYIKTYNKSTSMELVDETGLNLDFELKGEYAILTSYVEETVKIKHNILFDVWKEFTQKVYLVVTKTNPELVDFPFWRIFHSDYKQYFEWKMDYSIQSNSKLFQSSEVEVIEWTEGNQFEY